MNALRKPSVPTPSPRPPRRSPWRSPLVDRAQRTEISQRQLALEVGAKLAVNLVLASAALVGLVRLLPYSDARAVELGQLQTEVAQAEGRVRQLRAEFARQFDPQRAIGTMQEETRRVRAGDRYMLWRNNRPPSSPLQPGPANPASP